MTKLTKLKLDRSIWSDFVEDCPGATFFHTPEWFDIWKAYDDYRIDTELLLLPSGREVLLPLASKPRLGGLGRAYHSSPAGTYGGFLCKEPFMPADRTILYKYCCSFSMLLLLEAPFATSVLAEQGGEVDFTQLLDLKEGGGEVKNWSDNHRQSLKKGLATDYRFRAAQSPEDWKAYFAVYQDTVKRWGDKIIAAYDWPLFKILARLPGAICRLWLIEQKGRLAAGGIFFYFKQQVVHWHGATLSDHLPLCPTHLMHYHVIQDAVQRGYRYYDFNPSGGIEGVAQFKRSFGTEQKALHFLNWQSDSIKFIDELISYFRKDKNS